MRSESRAAVVLQCGTDRGYIETRYINREDVDDDDDDNANEPCGT